MSRMRVLAGMALVLGLTVTLVWALRPVPLSVDLALAVRAPMQVSISAEGVTRVRDPHVITAPISGATIRAPVQVGDRVMRGETVVAVIRPAVPDLMDARSRAQAEAAIAEAEAGVTVAEANLERAASALEHAQGQYARGEGLALAGTIPQRMFDDLRAALDQARQALASAEAEHRLRLASLQRARAQLVGPEATALPDGAAGDCCVQLHATLTGTVLEVSDRNVRQVTAGTPLVTIGDITDLEIEVDLLSTDALRVSPGTLARVTRWGAKVNWRRVCAGSSLPPSPASRRWGSRSSACACNWTSSRPLKALSGWAINTACMSRCASGKARRRCRCRTARSFGKAMAGRCFARRRAGCC
ncbi:MAG: efflux RND transporter periplasmic adaptor subunit [Pararhodobacter sp.]